LETKLFYLVEKMLKRFNISMQKMPDNLADWQDFLMRINRGFFDFEQERYLLERSMEISSREMLELNDKFEQAQETAHIGLWIYDRRNEKIFWTKETYRLFGIDTSQAVPNYKDVLALVHEKDQKKLDELVDRAFNEGLGYEIEFRIKNKKQDAESFHWVYAKGEIQTKINNEGETYHYLSGIIMDITNKKRAEEQLKELQQKLLLTARQAGMSEVATSVLHNIGNVLNSVNISLSLIKESLNKIKPAYLKETVKMFRENLPNTNTYFTADPKGKLVPSYLEVFSEQLNDSFTDINKEITNLDTNIQHIKSIVNMQTEISGVYGVNEKISLNDALDYALKINRSKDTNNITIVKDFEDIVYITTDKAKLLQILTNLIKNAKESVAASNNKNKFISIKIRSKGDGCEMIIKDNGVGIPKENLTRIFSLGYTTKSSGHGFGLHSSANAATELGGKLHAESEGINKGATFKLQLPYEYKR